MDDQTPSSPSTESTSHFRRDDATASSTAGASFSHSVYRSLGHIDLAAARSRSGSVASFQVLGGSQGRMHSVSKSNTVPFNLSQSSSSHIGLVGSTHAGGVLPPASFFHPSRPNHTAPMSRPRPSSFESEFSGSVGRTSTLLDDSQWQMGTFISSSRLKQSREPLLPIGGSVGRISTSSTRPKLHSAVSPVASSSEGISPGGRVRTSIERVFKRTLSLESHTRPKLSFDARTTDGQPSSNVEHGESAFNLKFAQPASTNGSYLRMPPRTSGPARQAAFPSFPPPASDSLCAVPVKDSQAEKVIRKWQLHPSHNLFFLQGRVLTGGDNPFPFIASLVFVFGLTGVWIGTTGVYWWQNESPAVTIIGVYLALVTISSMFATALRDPGILPRGLDPDPPVPATVSSDESTPPPLPRDLKVRRGVVRVKYCSTCQTYRPPRSSHCRICDNCVDGCDHHCQWVNNCVGRRNYTSFIACLIASTLGLCLYICTAALHIYLITRKDHVDAGEALGKAVGSAVVFSICIVVLWPVAGLLGYHIRLLVVNMTTVEQIRSTAHRSIANDDALSNPFTQGRWQKNVAELLCRPQGLAWLDAHSAATEDKRGINPGAIAHEEEGGEKPHRYA